MRAVPELGDVANNAAFRLLRFRDRGREALRGWALGFALAAPVVILYFGRSVPGIAEGMILAGVVLGVRAAGSTRDARELLSRPKNPEFEALHLAPLAPGELVNGVWAAILSRSRFHYIRAWSLAMFAGSWALMLGFQSPYRTGLTEVALLGGLIASLPGLVAPRWATGLRLDRLIDRLSRDLDNMVATYHYRDEITGVPRDPPSNKLRRFGLVMIVIYAGFPTAGLALIVAFANGQIPAMPVAGLLCVAALVLGFILPILPFLDMATRYRMLVSYARRHREVRMARPHLAPWA